MIYDNGTFGEYKGSKLEVKILAQMLKVLKA